MNIDVLLARRIDIDNILVMPATKSPGAILNARSAARRAKGRKPEVTQASSVLSHWITEYIHVLRITSCNSPFRLTFGHSILLPAKLVCPYGPAVGCSLKLMDSVLNITFSVMARRASHRDVTSKSAPGRFSPAENMPE